MQLLTHRNRNKIKGATKQHNVKNHVKFLKQSTEKSEKKYNKIYK